MESLGAKLKAVRESKGCSYEQVGRDTNIAVRYLEALEAENFAVFPGEPYVLGFLRNYGDYLGLDVQELLSLYRAFKIQEQPVPVDQLLQSPPRFPKIIPVMLIILLVLGGAGGGVYFFMNRPGTPPAAVSVRPVTEYTLNSDFLEQRLYRGDSVLVPFGEDQYKLTLANLGDIVTIAAPNDQIRLDLSQTVSVDMDDNGSPELQITLMDFAKNESGAGALLRFELAGAVPVSLSQAPQEAAVSTAPAAPPAGVVFPSSPSAFPFTLQVSFQGYCMFRYEILFERDRQDRNEQYYQRGNEVNIQAQNGIRIWASNAQAAKLQVIGGGRTVPLELGGAGEVVVADVRWVRDEENRYRLVLARLEQ
ncbi:MAG: helix-turn-helix domain-containing protein [Treponema sp.]|nr:helix-turn-helix domain-containing protein [Treponema sp.]